MRIAPKLIAVTIAAAFITVAATGPGFAGGSGHHGSPHHHGHKHLGHGYGHKRHHYGYLLLPFAYLFGFAHGALNRHPHHHQHSHGHLGHRHRSAPPACHPVTKVGYDAHGRRAKLGGTMCYDAYGQAYVVPGSRHVIHYYY